MEKRKVLADRHHAGLAYSLKLLLEDRFGWELYFPIGMEWADQGWWHVHEPYGYNRDTALQYLQLRPEYVPSDDTVPLNRVVAEHPTHYQVEELAHNYTQKCLTLQQFQEMDIDIIIASIPRHYEVYKTLRDVYKPKAKVVCQMGNMFNEVSQLLSDGTIDNFLSSTVPFSVPEKVNHVFYHQAINLDIFKPVEMQKITKITSFVNLLPQPEVYESLRAFLPSYEFRAYGSGCPDGVIHNVLDVSRIMQQSGWGFHNKPRCDGFGHVIFDWFAIGRPVIANVREYKNYLAGCLMKEGINCIALDNGDSLEVIAEKIQEASTIEHYTAMAKASKEAFIQCVDYKGEHERLVKFFDNLI